MQVRQETDNRQTDRQASRQADRERVSLIGREKVLAYLQKVLKRPAGSHEKVIEKSLESHRKPLERHPAKKSIM